MKEEEEIRRRSLTSILDPVSEVIRGAEIGPRERAREREKEREWGGER